MARPIDAHLSPEEIDQILAQEKKAEEHEGVPVFARDHLAACTSCQDQVRQCRLAEHKISGLKSASPARGGATCPSELELERLAAGLMSESDATEVLQHASGCDRCGSFLKITSHNFMEEPTSEELRLMAQLTTSKPEWQKELARRLSRQDRDLSPSVQPHERQWLMWRRSAFPWISAATAIAILILVLWLVKPFPAHSPEQLLAEAYTKERTLQMRIVGAQYSPLRSERGSPADESRTVSRLGRPVELLQAEAAISQNLREHPDDARWLAAKGRADLLDGNYDSAISSLQQSLDLQPEHSATIVDLASAYYERASTSRDAASDYASAVEMLGKVLAKEPDNLIALFNHAIACGELALYAQAAEDWNHYLRLDPNGSWASEARERLRLVEEKIDKHNSGLLLLSPQDFVRNTLIQNRSDFDSLTETYASTAAIKWLKSAFSQTSGDESSEILSAVNLLASRLVRIHHDDWLRDIIQKPYDPGLRAAILELAEAVQANARGDFERARQRATKAEDLFRAKSNAGGYARALVEEIYALHLSDLPSACIMKSGRLSSLVRRHSFPWIRVQGLLEEGVCQNMIGDIGSAQARFAEALSLARREGYATESLRALGFLAFVDREKGDLTSAWKNCRDGLIVYWASPIDFMPGYNLYSFMDLLAETAMQYHLQMTVVQQALLLLDRSQDSLLKAEEHRRSAKVALHTGNLVLAENQLRSARKFLDASPETDPTESYRLGYEIAIAGVEAREAKFDEATARLSRLRTQISNLSNRYVLEEFYYTFGDIRAAKGDLEQAVLCYESAIEIAESQFSKIRTEKERISWAAQAAPIYKSLVEVELKQGKAAEALDTLEHFRYLSYRGSMESDYESSTFSILRDLSSAHWKDRLSGVTVLVYAILRDHTVIWIVDQTGIQAHRLDGDQQELMAMAHRFAELCANQSSEMSSIKVLGRKLYDRLLGPAGISGKSRLILVDSDEPLARVPFEALIGPDNHYVAESKLSFSYLPGVFNLRRMMLRSGELNSGIRALLVSYGGSNAEFGLPALPDTDQEVLFVANKFPHSFALFGSQATLARIRAKLPESELFHFSGHATHRYGSTALLLGDLAKQRLDSASLGPLRLDQLRLVVLSACATGQGNEGNISDWDSLIRAFLTSGVPHVLATRWSVDSRATVPLISAFYTNLLLGKRVSEALRLAQVDLITSANSHPFFWAGFNSYGIN